MNDRTTYKKGMSQVAQIVMWAVGLTIPIVLASAGHEASVNAVQDDKIYLLNGQVSALQADATRIPIIEAKVDKLLEKQNVDPKLIEEAITKAVGQTIQSK